MSDVIRLDRGSHKSPEEGMCVMEAAAYFAGEPFSDRPACVSPVIGAFLRSWNDALDDETRQLLVPYILRVIGTATNDEDEETRACLATDWFVRILLAWKAEDAVWIVAAAWDAAMEDAAMEAEDAVRVVEAAWGAAWEAAGDTLAVTVAVQKSAFDLLDRMIAVGKITGEEGTA